MGITTGPRNLVYDNWSTDIALILVYRHLVWYNFTCWNRSWGDEM